MSLEIDKVINPITGNQQDLLQLDDITAATYSGHKGWRLWIPTTSGSVSHFGLHDENGIITNRSVYHPTNQSTAETVIGPYDPSSTVSISFSGRLRHLTAYHSTMLVVRKITIKRRYVYNTPPPDNITIEVSDNTTDGKNGQWYPIITINNPFDNGYFITLPVLPGVSDKFVLDTVSDNAGNLTTINRTPDVARATSIPDMNHGVVEFVDLDELNDWKYCYTKPTIFKTVDNDKMYVWGPHEDTAQSTLKELA